jgi:transposase
MLLPPTVDEYVGPSHRVRVIVEVVERLDLSGFRVGVSDEGRPAYPPEILVSLLFYAFSIGIFSAREMERRCQTDCAFMFATAGLRPSHRSISRFRAANQDELSKLFAQIVGVCRRAGLGNTSRVAIDGTRQHANASLDAHVRKEQLEKELGKIREDMKKLLDRASQVDSEEDRDPESSNGDDLVPEGLEKKDKRAAAIEAAVKELTTEPRGEAEAEAETKTFGEEGGGESGGHNDEDRHQSIAEKQQRAQEIEEKLKELEQSRELEANDTDPDARLQRFKEGSRPGYNAQIGVSGEDKLILAADVTQDPGDKLQLIPMCDQVTANTGEKPGVITADSNYESGENLAALAAREQDAVIASACTKSAHKARERTGLFQWVDFSYDATLDRYICPAGRPLVRVSSGTYKNKPVGNYQALDSCAGCPLKMQCTKLEKRTLRVQGTTPRLLEMSKRRKLDRETDRFGAKRKVDVEPRFGHMKHNLRWRQFIRRGLAACRSEFRILCAAMNLSTLARWLESQDLAVSQIPQN